MDNWKGPRVTNMGGYITYTIYSLRYVEYPLKTLTLPALKYS